MSAVGPSRKTSHSGSAPKGNVRHKRLVKQSSDPLKSGSKHLAVKDIYSSSKNVINNCFDAELNGSSVSRAALRRFSQSGVKPASEEFQSVLRDFISKKPEEKPKEPKLQSSKTKTRKISFNEFGRASRLAKRLEDMSSPLPKRSVDSLTAPTSIIPTNRPTTDHRIFENNGAFAQSRNSLVFHGIKEAWSPERSFGASKFERRRHVSLPTPPTAFSLDKVPPSIVEPQHKPATEKTQHNKSNSNYRSRSGRKISTVISPNFSMSEPAGPTRLENARKSSGNSESWNENEDSNGSTEIPPQNDAKKKQFASANGPQDLHPNLLLGIKSKQTGSSEVEFPCLEKQLSTEDTAGEHHVAMKAHKNFKRIGKAAVAARRFLKIRNVDGGATQKRAISPLAKEDKEFEEMVEVMKSSYQDLCLDGRQKSDVVDEL